MIGLMMAGVLGIFAGIVVMIVGSVPVGVILLLAGIVAFVIGTSKMLRAQGYRGEGAYGEGIYGQGRQQSELVELDAIAKPDKVFTDNMGPLLAALEHEKYVTSLIDAIYAEAYMAKDFRTMEFLNWFVKEQGEEETNANDLITKMELFGSDPKSLYMLNQELMARVYTAPSLVL